MAPANQRDEVADEHFKIWMRKVAYCVFRLLDKTEGFMTQTMLFFLHGIAQCTS
jgi:hypothetical protein